MELLPDELRSRLPPLHTQEAEADPLVYARYYLPQTDSKWYTSAMEKPREKIFCFLVSWLITTLIFAASSSRNFTRYAAHKGKP